MMGQWSISFISSVRAAEDHERNADEQPEHQQAALAAAATAITLSRLSTRSANRMVRTAAAMPLAAAFLP